MRKLGTPLVVVVSLAALAAFASTANGTETAQAPSSPESHPDSQETQVVNPRQADEAPAQERKSVRPPVYQPPRRGAPLVRVGGGTRGEGDTQPTVYALVPAHTGLTTETHPNLFWYSSGPAEARLEFALIDDRSIDPVLEIPLQPTRGAGIQRIELSAYGVELSPGLEYQWSVALIPEPEQRSRDRVATGRIERVPLTPALANELETAAPEELPALYAQEGLWYDALATLSALVEARPTDATLRGFRADLLEQAGLRDVAAAERQSTR